VKGNTSDRLDIEGKWEILPDASSQYVVVEGARTETGLETVRETVQNTALMDYNHRRQADVDVIRRQLEVEVGLTENDFVAVPALLGDSVWQDWELRPRATALVPSMVNLLVDGRTVVVPKPFGPRTAGGDVFEQEVRRRLEAIGLVVRFVDEWEAYHCGGGEIHCGTNALRIPTPDVHWWD
jgi:protein-arginine deiminase